MPAHWHAVCWVIGLAVLWATVYLAPLIDEAHDEQETPGR